MTTKNRSGRTFAAPTGKKTVRFKRKMRAKGNLELSPKEPVRRDRPARKATTFRLDPPLQVGLVVLGRLLKQPLNRLVNEAVQGFLEKRSAEVEADLERALQHLKAYRSKDPGFESALQQFVAAEASFGREDALEGRPRPVAGAAQAMVRDLLRG